MNTQILNDAVGTYLAQNPWIILVIIWSAVWKLIALWKASRNNHLTIFIVLAILNTVGIAEIAYLVYLKMKSKKETQATE
jgi:methionyl-tRNA synthetase